MDELKLALEDEDVEIYASIPEEKRTSNISGIHVGSVDKAKLKGLPESAQKDAVEDGRLFRNTDYTGQNTVIYKQFGSSEEMEEWSKTVDLEELVNEIRKEYGRGCSGMLDPKTFRLLIVKN